MAHPISEKPFGAAEIRRMLSDPAAHFEGLLVAAAAAAAERDIHAVERLTDRARRLAGDDPAIALIHTSLLRRLGRYDEVLEILGRRDHLDATPEWGLTLIEARLGIGDIATAADLINRILRLYALESLGSLPRLVDTLITRGETAFIGWIALTASGRWVGSAPPGTSVVVTDEAGNMGATGRADESGRCEIDLPWDLLSAGLRIESPAGPLLGGGNVGRPDFRLAGTATLADNKITGWARLGWSPASSLTLLLEDSSGRGARLHIPAAADEHLLARPEYAASPRALGLHGEISVKALQPDGSEIGLAGSPLRRPTPRVRPQPVEDPPPRAVAGTPPATRVSVVIPVHGGRGETLACLRSVLRTVDPATTDVVVVDDASPDHGLVGDLDALAADGRFTLLRNGRNLGFPGSANRGIGHLPGNDVVLLNADAEVYGDWLVRLRRAAYAAPEIGTATPLTNCGSIVSYPAGREGECDAALAADLDFVAAEVNRGRVVDLPTGIGFCLYLRRDCIDETGLLDAETFGRGYGEEDDFCLRARRRGWRSVAATDVFVRHIGAASFGAMRMLRIEHAERLIEARHPGFLDLVRRFVDADPLRPARRAIDEARLKRHRRRSALDVTVALTGGIDRYLDDRRPELAADRWRTIELRPNAKENAGGMCRLRVPGAPYEDLVYKLPDEIGALSDLLTRIGVERVEFHEFLGHSPAIFELPDRLGVPFGITLHDYVWICPRIVLIDEDARYCGEPDLAGCDTCIRTQGAFIEEDISTGDLRRRSLALMERADRVLAPSRDTARRISRYFPEIPIVVRPWEAPPAVPAPPPSGGDGRIRVALVGGGGWHKGLRILRECALDAERRGLPLDFVLIGTSVDDCGLFETGRIFVTGVYEEGEIDRLIARERCQVALFPQVWPETWCYSLTHARRAGLPIVAFAIGAIAERLADADLVRLLPPGQPPAVVNDALLELARQAAERHNAARQIAARGAGISDSSGLGRIIDVSTIPNVPVPAGAKPELTSTVQVLTLGEGLYAFGVRGGAGSASPNSELVLPALHVGLAPSSARGGQLTILSAPTMPSPWLTRPGDAIVAAVSGGTCHIVLTSLNAQNAPPLEIEVRQLDQRPAASVVPEPAKIVAGSNQPVPEAAAPEGSLVRLQVLTHIQNRGDVPFVGGAWAGFIGQSVWLEAFALAPLEKLPPNAIEYKARTAGGFETPWLSGGVWCGTRGMGVPLVEFAVRLIPELAATYECDYSGAFFSGNIIGPRKDGAACRSRVPNDPLEAIQIRVTERVAEKPKGRGRS